MEFLQYVKLNGLKQLIRSKNRDEIRGRIEAEKDLLAVLSSVLEFNALLAYMETKFVQDAETVLFERLLKTKDLIEEKRIISQLKHTKKLQKQFMQYVKTTPRKEDTSFPSA